MAIRRHRKSRCALATGIFAALPIPYRITKHDVTKIHFSFDHATYAGHCDNPRPFKLDQFCGEKCRWNHPHPCRTASNDGKCSITDRKVSSSDEGSIV